MVEKNQNSGSLGVGKAGKDNDLHLDRDLDVIPQPNGRAGI